MQGCQPIFYISPGSQMLQHGPPKKKEPDWRVDRGSDGSRWFIAVVHSFVWIKLEAWISAPNGRYIQQWNQWDKLQKKHVVIGKIQGSLRTLNRLSDYPCVYIYIYMGPSVKHRPAPNQPLSMVKKSSFSGCFIPSLGLNPNSWMGQMQFVVWPKYMFIVHYS